MKISFLGATKTVTGSKYLVETRGRKILIDCGLFQGLKELRLRNWDSMPFDPKEIDAVILTHAHLDHSGYLPLLVRKGFSGPIYATSATHDLCKILLPDSGHIQESDARRANKYGYSKHNPALALYTEEDAMNALQQFKSLEFDKDYHIDGKIVFSFHSAGHILGASFVRIDDEETSVIFSGDIGRMHDPLMKAPSPLLQADNLVIESTYGDRLHEKNDLQKDFAEIVNKTSARGGSVLVPAFAVGRAQLILYYVHELKKKKLIPDLPVYLDSPMSVDATELFCKHGNLHRLGNEECEKVFSVAEYIRSVEESKAIDASAFPSIIISASGMASGGRVLHHMKVMLKNHRNTILFAGFQAAGTRGRDMINGAKNIKIHGDYFPVKAEIANLDGASAHADYEEILQWLKSFPGKPQQVFVTHGEEESAQAMASKIKQRYGWDTLVPEYLQEVTL